MTKPRIKEDWFRRVWQVMETYLQETPFLVAHQLEGYNQFVETGIAQIIRENNPIRFFKEGQEILLYFGGKQGNQIYFGKPMLVDEGKQEYLWPNVARLRNMTYAMSIHYDVDLEFTFFVSGEEEKRSLKLDRVYLGKMPIMLHSHACILHGLPAETRYYAGECREDQGGYFIVDGMEKVILPQEKFADNMLYVREFSEGSEFLYSCEIRSVSEDTSKPTRYTSVKMLAPTAKISNRQFVVALPNVRKPVPLFLLMRALGILSDKRILEFCLLDLEQEQEAMEIFRPSIYDASNIYTQRLALEFIGKLTKRQTLASAQDILMNYFLPHVGVENWTEKAYFVGMMVGKIVAVILKRESATDRDHFQFKRVETAGVLLHHLFREYYLIQQKELQKLIGITLYYKPQYLESLDAFVSLITENTSTLFAERVLENGIRRAFKGNWGGSPNTKKIGVVQDLNRLSWFTYGDMVRKIILPMESSSKAVGPHLLHASQWGYMDPVDSPDGGNIGLHKHLAITAAITTGFPPSQLINWLLKNFTIRPLKNCTPLDISRFVRVFVNGNWIGMYTERPFAFIEKIKCYRRLGILPLFLSLSFDTPHKSLSFFTDSGRVSRPIFYLPSTGNPSPSAEWWKKLDASPTLTWQQLSMGTSLPTPTYFTNDLASWDAKYMEHRALIEYIDCMEEESALIALHPSESPTKEKYTHLEIHPSILFGIMGNSIIFPEFNQYPRDCFSCSQSRQAVALSHTNAESRMDKMLVLLQNGQIPLIKSPYLEYINHELPYGFNTMVAIMTYTGYNVEDAILINEASLHRGLFRTTYYTTYESQEVSEKVQGTDVRSYFTNLAKQDGVKGLKAGYDYSQLDDMGLIKEGTVITDKTVLIGQVIQQIGSSDKLDKSVRTKKGQYGVVDKVFLTEGEEGFRIAKVRIREELIPAIGDKMASRAGQKGTIGRIIPERDMPFTGDGQRPDLIINPHAFPSRMTISHLLESEFGKVCASYGMFGNCGAFMTDGPNTNLYGQLLQKMGMTSNGKEIMYAGFSGKAIEADVYFGPTYYLRLKHMTKYKINYRARGPRNNLTRQTVQGRANDGGLRIGEMERDGILAHGASAFLTESFMIRGDQYYLAICNQTGRIAFYDAPTQSFYSPWVDGPLIWKDQSLLGKEGFPIHGTSFSVVCIPYSLKLFIQELQVLNIDMRFITEDAYSNENRIKNLSFGSQNAQQLLHLEGLSNAEVLSHFKKSVLQQIRKNQSGGSFDDLFPTTKSITTTEKEEKNDDNPDPDEKNDTNPDPDEKNDDTNPDPEEKDEGNSDKKDEGNSDEKDEGNSDKKDEGNSDEKDEGNSDEKDEGNSNTAPIPPMFENPIWNDYYHKLSKTTQISLLDKTKEEREKIMQDIITQMQQAENTAFAASTTESKEPSSPPPPPTLAPELPVSSTESSEKKEESSGKIVVEKEE